MKRLMIALLMLALLAPAAYALTIDVENATLEELQAAQEQITAQITKLKAASTPAAAGAVELSGSGAAIEVADVQFAPSRITITAPKDSKFTLGGGSYDHKYDVNGSVVEFLDDVATFDLLAESSGDWTFKAEPIVDGGSSEITATGPAVTDFFDLPKAQIFTVTADFSKMSDWLGTFNIDFCHQYDNMDSWRTGNVVFEMVTEDTGVYTKDIVVKPVKGRTQYAWAVKAPQDVTWSIAPKG